MLGELKGGSSTYKARQRQNRKRLTLRLFVMVSMLLMLCVIAGFGYAWYNARKHPVQVTPVVAPKPKEPTIKAPTTFSDDTPVGVATEVVTNTIVLGANGNVSIKTLPTAACTIRVTYADGQTSKDAGLAAKPADDFGVANWTWTVEQTRPPGKALVETTCVHGKKSGYMKNDITIQKAG